MSAAGRRKLILALGAAVAVGGAAAWWLRPLVGDSQRNRQRVAPRPQQPAWAEPLVGPGLPNLHRVTKDLYRGGQPTAEGVRQLKAMGIRTIVNLRSFHSDRDEIGQTGLAYERMYVKVWHPEDEEVVRFLQIAADPSRCPVFVHCKLGSDRTGLMCAAYRVAVCGWSKEQAIEEMTQGGFGFNRAYANLVEYIRTLDVAETKRRAGLGP